MQPNGVCVYDEGGRKTTLLTPPVMWGLAWAADDAVWVAGGPTFRDRSLYLVTPTRPPQEVYRDLASISVQDASRDGRLLLHHGFERMGVRAKPPGEDSERELGVFSWSWVADLTADGAQLLAVEGNGPGRAAGAAMYVRPTRGGPAVRLGEGSPLALSPDGKWVLVDPPGEPPRLIVTPTGPGESHALPGHRFETIDSAWFLEEGQLLVDAAVTGERSRAYLLAPSGGEPRPVTPEGIVSIRGSYRDGSVMGAGPDGTLARYPLRGGDPQPVAARLPTGTRALRASGDGRFVFVGRSGMPYHIDRLEIATGRSTPWKAVRPDDVTGSIDVRTTALSADGEAYAYTYGRYFQDLYLVESLRP